MRFSILTLFPDIISAYANASIMGRAQKNGTVSIEAINFRDFSADPHRKVDDSPFGGGSGMVLSCQPVESAYESLLPLPEGTRMLLTSPAGRRFDHAFALELADAPHVVIFCGHYEGFDERLMTLIPNMEEVSIGDYVVTGGELPALSIVDAVTRLIPGAVQKFSSVQADSFYNGLLDYPHYTRPAEYKGLKVPDVLMSGNHKRIDAWRNAESITRTKERRPDL